MLFRSDYGDNDYRYEIEGEDKGYDYEKASLGSMGYQRQEFDEESGALISAEDEEEEDDESGDVFDEEFEMVLDSDSFDE